MTEKPEIIIKAIIEMLGGPKEHIEKTLADYIEKLKEDITVKNVEIHEAKPQGTLFSCFADLEISFAKPIEVLDFCFDSMPSSIEIVSPDPFKLPAEEFTAFLNDLQARIHENDMLLKNIQSAKKLLDKSVVNIFRNFIKYTLKQGEKEVEEVSAIVGVEEKDLKPFMDKMIEENILTKKQDKYSLKNG